jgi:hypothetical protein
VIVLASTRSATPRAISSTRGPTPGSRTPIRPICDPDVTFYRSAAASRFGENYLERIESWEKR